MKKLFFTLSLLLLSLTASAQYTRSIHLSADDGTDVLLNLSRSLTIKFDNANLIASDGEQTVAISLDKVKMTYSTEEVSTGIAELLEQDYTFGGDAITFQGLKKDQPIRVFSVDGKLLMTILISNEGGKASIRLSTLPIGISIIQAGNHSLKYYRK